MTPAVASGAGSLYARKFYFETGDSLIEQRQHPRVVTLVVDEPNPHNARVAIGTGRTSESLDGRIRLSLPIQQLPARATQRVDRHTPSSHDRSNGANAPLRVAENTPVRPTLLVRDQRSRVPQDLQHTLRSNFNLLSETIHRLHLNLDHRRPRLIARLPA